MLVSLDRWRSCGYFYVKHVSLTSLVSELWGKNGDPLTCESAVPQDERVFLSQLAQYTKPAT